MVKRRGPARDNAGRVFCCAKVRADKVSTRTPALSSMLIDTFDLKLLKMQAAGLRRRRVEVPYVTTDDGVRLYFEEAGTGRALILVHEFAGDIGSFEAPMRTFGRR